MQRHRQRHIAFLGKTVDLGNQTGGRQRDPLVGEAKAEVVAHDVHRAHHVVEIEQGLAHTHHHHVGQLALKMRHVAQMLGRNPDLADDLGRTQVAVEALSGGGTELAVEAAADLR